MAKQVFVLCEETMRSPHSGFSIEGTDIQMDYPEDYPLPLETEVMEDGGPVALRVLPHCKFIEKEKQIAAGYPEKFRWQDGDRNRLNFHYGRLELDEARDKIYLEFLTRSSWLKGNENKKARPTTKTICQRYDELAEIQEDIDFEEITTKAKNLVFSLDERGITDLFRLSTGGTYALDASVTNLMMKKHLLALSSSNPKFILMGVASTKDKIVVLLTKAIEYRIISLTFDNQVAIYSPPDKEWMPLIQVSDDLGAESKFDKTVEYLMTEKAAIELTIIEKQVSDHETQVEKTETRKSKK